LFEIETVATGEDEQWKDSGPVFSEVILRLIVTHNAETFLLLSRRANESLACVKPKRRNTDSERKGQK